MEKHWLKSYPPGVRAEVNVDQYPSLKEMIERGLAIHSVRDAYVQMGKAMTFGELDVLSMQFQDRLHTTAEYGPSPPPLKGEVHAILELSPGLEPSPRQ